MQKSVSHHWPKEYLHQVYLCTALCWKKVFNVLDAQSVVTPQLQQESSVFINVSNAMSANHTSPYTGIVPKMSIEVTQNGSWFVGFNPSQGTNNFFHEFQVQCIWVWAICLYQTQGRPNNFYFNMYTLPPSAGVLKQGYMYPEGYVCLSEGVYLRLIIEGKNMFTYYSFRNIYRYISEYYFQNHYMLIAKYVFVIFLTLFVIKMFWGTCSSLDMLNGYMTRESLGTPVLAKSIHQQSVPAEGWPVYPLQPGQTVLAQRRSRRVSTRCPA